MGNLRISGSRVLGRLKKSCNCCGNPDIYAIHLLPTAYPSKKLANSREKKRKKNLKKNISRFNGGAQNSTYSHSLILFKGKKHQTNSKNSFSPSLCFLLLLFSYTIFSLSSIFTSNLKRKENILKEKKNQLQIKKMAHPSRRIRSLNI